MSAEPSLADRHAAALEWLMNRINYERVAVLPYSERQMKLDRMRQLLTRLGSPDASQRIIHIAGTKGKGSTAAMLASILKHAGHRVGVYSSPHLERIEERFAVDGQPCSPAELVALVDHLRPVVEALDNLGGEIGGPTFFDITTAMALVLFADREVETTVLEVGLGGRLDSTNVCHPVVAAVTSIGLDHTKQLGNTLEAIAAEKAGIIKPGVPVVSSETQPGPRDVIALVAREHGCRLTQRGADFDMTSTTTTEDPVHRYRFDSKSGKAVAAIRIGLDGEHQAANAATALAIVEELNRQGWRISEEACQLGLASTRLPARVEWFPGEPTIVVDAAHNATSAAALAAAITAHPAPGGRTLLLALSRDKDGPAIVRELARNFDRFVITRYLDNPRAVPPEEVAKIVQQDLTSRAHSATITTATTPLAAWQIAHDQTHHDGLIVATGSFFLAAEIRPLAVACDNKPTLKVSGG